MTIIPHIARISDVDLIIGHYFGGGEFSTSDLHASVQSVDDLEDNSDETAEDGDSEVVHLDQPAPPGRDGRVVRLVNQILSQALHERASDIHLEPFEDSCAVRFRIDGKLNSIATPPRALFVPIVSRLKVLAKLDIAEKRLPQDGAIALRSSDRRVDLRVSTVPTVHGEKVVLRILDKGAIPHDLSQLGLDTRQADDMLASLSMPHGLILVTGPTGSGKSTTLYSCLQRLNQPDCNICTVEDPVEYKFHGINQVQTKSQIGLTFASALRSFLRQDPDVIMLGEIRDQETADISMRAALTGHVVLSTLHTNDALSAVTRLTDMGIEPFLLGSTLRLVEAQRLLRKLCKDCKEPYTCDSLNAERFGLDVGEPLYRAGECDNCRGTGYSGRIGIFEVIAITRELEALIQSGAGASKLSAHARDSGVQSLLGSALEKVRAGETSLEVALSVGHSADH